MKIERIEIHLVRVPFDMGAAPKVFAGRSWTSVDSLFVRGAPMSVSRAGAKGGGTWPVRPRVQPWRAWSDPRSSGARFPTGPR